MGRSEGVDASGFEPEASRLRSERSTADLRARKDPSRVPPGMSANVNVRGTSLVLGPPADEPEGP